jgi:Carboxypeptidase regulatory-like domain
MRKISLLSVLLIAIGIFPSVAATTSLSGKVVDQANKAIVGVKVNLIQSNRTVSTLTTGSDGSYSFSVVAGAYSLQLVPPSAGYSTLNEYNILLPAPQPITFMLTPPSPGRAFLTGHVIAPIGFELDPSTTYIGFGNSSSLLQDSSGYFKLMPTAGTNSTFGITGQLKGESFNFKMTGKTSMTLNQDAIAEFRVPLYRQRVRVITAAGTPVAGAIISGGVSLNGAPARAMSPIEGVGAFDGTWSARGIQTDANGYANIPALTLAASAPGHFDISPPSSYKVAGQGFDVTVGAGDITLKLTVPIPMVTGTVKDLSGTAIDRAVVTFMDGSTGTGAATDSLGKYSVSLPASNTYAVSIGYKNGAYSSNLMFATNSAAPNFVLTKDTTLNLTVPVEKTRVKVLDTTGLPVPNATVSIKPSSISSTDYTGSWTLLTGQKPLSTYFYSTATTDANGIAVIPTIHLDSETNGDIFASIGTGASMAYISSVQKIGAGKDVTLTLKRPTIQLSGRLSFTDGSQIPSAFNISFSNGRGQDAQITRDSKGNYVGTAFAGTTGYWWLGCGRVDLSLSNDFCASLVGGPTSTLNANAVQDLAIPTYKTPVQIVDPNGKGIPNVKVLLNSQMSGNGTVTLFPGQPPLSSYFLSVATTDSSGIAMLESLKMDSPQKAYLEITPDPNSRYQTRSASITVGDNSKNVIVLTIPKPVISSVTVSTINGVLTATITGENFAGAFSVTVGTYSFNEFISVNGVVTTQGFKVIDTNHITFPVPTGLVSGTVAVTNGGGTTSSQGIKFTI